MNNSYTATYYTADHRSYTATVFISSVTVTIRYRDDNNEAYDINWLEKDIIGFDEKSGGAELQYRNRDGAVERLLWQDPALLQAVKKQLRHNRNIGKTHQRLFSSAWSKIGLVAGIFIGILLIGYLWFVPWLGERIAMNFSKDYEISMGQQMYQAIAASYKVDERKTALLNKFYSQLQYNVDYPIQVTVVASPEMNAFAIPGGHIVVYDAILERMKTPEELAALLGHEASHIALRHSLRNMFRSLARKMFLALVVGNQSGIVSVMVDNADDLKGLSYSRSLETEADDNGLQLMSAGGWDAQGMVRLMELLQKETGGHQPASFLNTHPVFNDRIKNIKEQIKKLPPATGDNSQLAKTFRALYESQW